MASCFKALCLLLAISASLQYVLNEKTKVNNRSSMGMIAQQEGITNINSNSKTEKINMGTRKTTNYNFGPSHYKPTQTTQVILNVPPHPEPAASKTNRRTRPPTEEEVEIKEKILELFERAMNEKDNELHKAHLGKVLEALNPKYIATQRVRRVVFSDPKQFSDLQKVASSNESVEDETVAESEPEPTAEQLQNELNDKVQAQLNDLVQRFAQEIQFTPEFLDKLHRAEENILTPHQLAFKHIILCVTDPSSCSSEMLCSGKQPEQQQQQPEEQQQQQEPEQEQQHGPDEQSEQNSSDQYQEDGQHVEQPAEYAGEYQQYPEEDQYQYNQNDDEFPQQYADGRQYDKSEYRTPAQDVEHYSPARDSFSPPHYTKNQYGLEKPAFGRSPRTSSTKTEDGSYQDELNQPDGLVRTESERSFGYLPEKVYHDYNQQQPEQPQRPMSIGGNWAADVRRGQPVEEEQEGEASVDSIRYGAQQARVGPPAQQRPLASRTQIPEVVPRPESRTSIRSQEAPMPRAVETVQLQRPAQAVPKPVNSFTSQQHQPRNQAKALADNVAAARAAASQRQGPLRGLKASLPTPKTQTTKPASSSSTISPGFLNGAPVPQKSSQGQRSATTSQTSPGSTGSESVNTSTGRV